MPFEEFYKVPTSVVTVDDFKSTFWVNFGLIKSDGEGRDDFCESEMTFEDSYQVPMSVVRVDDVKLSF